MDERSRRRSPSVRGDSRDREDRRSRERETRKRHRDDNDRPCSRCSSLEDQLRDERRRVRSIVDELKRQVQDLDWTLRADQK